MSMTSYPTLSNTWRRPAERRPREQRGLTLVELLIVISILSVLTAIALPITKGIIESSRISESVRTVQAFMEAARSRAMASGREHGVEFIRAGVPSSAIGPDDAGRVTELRLTVGMPSYRGEVEGAQCFLYHENTYRTATYDSTQKIGGTPMTTRPPVAQLVTMANCAIFDGSQCPSLVQSYRAFEDAVENGSDLTKLQPSIRDGDWLLLDGVAARIIGFASCNGTEPPFIQNPALVPANFVKVFFDPRSTTQEATMASMGTTMSVPEPPPLPQGGMWRRPFEIKRSQLRPGAARLTLQRGAAIDLYFSGSGANGTEFSPQTMVGATALTDLAAAPDLLSVVVVFSPNGEVSRVLMGQQQSDGTVDLVSQVPKSSIHFLVGRTDEIRSDLLFSGGLLPVGVDRDLTNIVDPRSRWLTINAANGRIRSTTVRAPRPGAATIQDQTTNARLPALQAREQL